MTSYVSPFISANKVNRQADVTPYVIFAETAVFEVSNTNNSGSGSLRQAILDANANAGEADTITFNISGAGPHIINPVGALPTITDALVIDGTTEPDFAGAPLIVLDGSSAGDVSGLTLSANNCTIKGLVINNFSQHGILINSNGNVIGGNYIGTDASGMAEQSNGVAGVYLTSGAANNTIGGSTDAERNVIAGNSDDNLKVEAAAGSGNTIIGNYIGVDVLGTSSLVNGGSGVDIQADGNILGGTNAGERNIIAGCNYNGVVLSGDNNTIQGNYIGTDVSGTMDLGNSRNGIWINGGSNNLVGGTDTSAGNLIRSNGRNGVLVSNGMPTSNVILGNSIFGNSWIGIDLSLDTNGDSVTNNDLDDLDVGPNGLQNFPLLDNAVTIGNHTFIAGSFQGGADTTFRVEFYSSAEADPTGYGEGEVYLGFTTIISDGSGNASFDIMLPDVTISEGQFVSATATADLDGENYGNSSEFSAVVTVPAYSPPNDLPCSATVLSGEDSCSFHVFNNIESGESGIPLSGCMGDAVTDVWFKAEVPASGVLMARLDVDPSPEIPIPDDWLLRPGLAVYSGVCGALIQDTCWIDSAVDPPFQMPEILLTGYSPGDTLFFRVWGYDEREGFFRICVQEPEIEIFEVSGSGSYCIGASGIPVSINGSQLNVEYQLQKNGMDVGIPLMGSGSTLEWPDQTEGIYEVVAGFNGTGLSDMMSGKAIVLEIPPPVITFGFRYEKIISIESDSVAGTQDLNYFPLLVSIPGDPDLRTTGNGGHVESANGFDIVFTDDSHNPLPFERITYSPETGAFVAWVNVPLLSHSTDTDIHMLYGNQEIDTDLSSVETWSSEFIQVMHFENDFRDASRFGNYGENLGTSDTLGWIGRGRGFDGIDNRIIVRDDSTLDGTNDEATLSLWVNFADASDGDHQIIMTTENRYDGGGYEWASQGSGNHFFYPNGNDNDNYNLGPNPFTDGAWHYLVTTLNFSTREVDIYVDGIPMPFSTENVPSLWTELATLDRWTWGGDPARSSRYLLGLMDEVRVQTKARSEGWILTVFRNQRNPQGFYSLSAEIPFESLPPVCQNAAPFDLPQPRPLGGTLAGPGVNGLSFSPGDAGPGIHALSYSYTDGNGCAGSGSREQTVLSSPIPEITGNKVICPNSSGEIYSTPAVEGHSYNWTITGSEAIITGGQGSHEITVDWGSVSGSLRLTETNDETGCDSTTAEFMVSVGDITGPLFDCPGDLVQDLGEDCSFAFPDYSNQLTLTDNCDPEPYLIQSPPADTLLEGSGVILPVVLTALDQDGNTTVCSFTFTLIDNTPPTALEIRDTTVTAEEGFYEAYVELQDPVFVDNCGILTVENDVTGGPNASGTYPYGTTTVSYTVVDVNENQALFTQEITVNIEDEPADGLIIPEAFSPNEDGLNDRFVILGLEKYSENNLHIYNAHGIEVFQMTAYDNSWDGTAKGHMDRGTKLPTGTYYYVLYLNGKDALRKGFLYLRRE
jgi:gliding motility-associated-like protein